MNSKEVSNKKFEKAAFGYKPDEVDEFVKEVSIKMAQLQKDKEDSDKKIDVLADKVRDYMRDEEVIKEALLGAQRQGRQVIDEAQQTSAKIISEANQRSEQIIGETKHELEKEKLVLSKMQKEVSDFKAQLLSLYKKHLDLITAMPDADESEIDEQISSEEQPVQQEPAQENPHPSTEQKKHSFNYANSNTDSHYTDLKFGNNSK